LGSRLSNVKFTLKGKVQVFRQNDKFDCQTVSKGICSAIDIEVTLNLGYRGGTPT